MTARTEIHTDGTFDDRTGVGGWAAVITRTASGRQEDTSSHEMELRGLLAAVNMAEGPCTVISDHQGLVSIAQRGMAPRMCRELWEELYAAAEGKDVTFEWHRRNQTLGSRIAHQLAREAARG